MRGDMPLPAEEMVAEAWNGLRGDVPQKVVPDNLKAAVIRESFEDPLVNRSYRMLAWHYNFLISPHLPYHLLMITTFPRWDSSHSN